MIKTVIMRVCEGCLEGKSGMCHEPGCVFIRQRGPEWPVAPEQIQVLEAWEEDGQGGMRRVGKPPKVWVIGNKRGDIEVMLGNREQAKSRMEDLAMADYENVKAEYELDKQQYPWAYVGYKMDVGWRIAEVSLTV